MHLSIVNEPRFERNKYATLKFIEYSENVEGSYNC